MSSPARMCVQQPRLGRGKPPARTAGGLRARAWWLMRTTQRFTLDDLLLTLADGTESDAPGNLHKYLRALERAGVIKRLTRRAAGTSPKSNGHVIWRLVRDLGPLAPVWRQHGRGGVWDGNASVLLPLLDSLSATATATAADPHGTTAPDQDTP